MTSERSFTTREAVRFYAPMFLLYSVYDGAEDKEAVVSLLDDMLDSTRARLMREGST